MLSLIRIIVLKRLHCPEMFHAKSHFC